MKISFIALVIIFCSSVTTAQTGDTLKVSLKASFALRDLHTRVTVPVTKQVNKKYKGYPTCEAYQIGACILNRGQFIYDEYRRGNKSYNDLLAAISRYKIDTNSLTRQYIRTCVNIFSGLKKNKKIIIIDLNNDNDFSDDITYEFDTLSTNKWFKGDTMEVLPLVHVNYEVLENNEIKQRHTYIRVKPYDYSYTYDNDLDRKLAVYTINSVSKIGVFSINGEEFKVNLCLSPKGILEKFSNSYYYKIQRGELYYKMEVYEQNKNEVVVFGHTFKAIDYKLDGDVETLLLLYSGVQKNPIGGYLGFSIPKIQGVDSENKPIQIEQSLSKNKYVLLEFWGSWCAPCIKSIPAIKDLYSKINQDKIQFFGVDYEYNDQGRNKAHEIIKEHNIKWLQIAETPPTVKKGFKVAEALDVKNYPTLLLISPTGKIVARETGENTVKKIEEYLRNMGLTVD